MECEQPLDAVGDMLTGQRAAADVHDVDADLERIGQRLADELVAPLELADLIAVRLAILDHLELAHAAVGIDADRVGDELVLADDLIDDEPAHQLAGSARLPDMLL